MQSRLLKKLKRAVTAMYKVQIERKAQKKLLKIPSPYYEPIRNAILNLAREPRPHGCKKLKGRDAFRIRIADYRIIYEIHDAIFLIQVINLGHRKDIY